MRSQYSDPSSPQSHQQEAGDVEHRSSLFGEQLIRLNDVRRLLPPREGGRRPGLSSIYRWCERGIRGVKLEWYPAPWGRMTSVEAVERFLIQLNKGKPPLLLTPARRRRQIAEATKRVEAMLGLNKNDGKEGRR